MKIVFTSCMDAIRQPNQPIWDELVRRQPDVLMLLGDSIYMDWCPPWVRAKLIKNAKTSTGLQGFAQTMHARYAAQWDVVNFRTCIQTLAAQGTRMLLTWDDHDFAWNNSFRQHGVQVEMNGVPRTIMDVSKRLFEQFRGVITHSSDFSSYPPLASDWNEPLPNTQAGTELMTTVMANGQAISLNLLDTRWYRTSRGDAHLSILGNGSSQRQSLIHEITHSQGLLIVAAGTPLNPQNGWNANDYWQSTSGAGSFPEYVELLDQAHRPVLYVSGDIHKNAYVNDLKKSNGELSQVLQVLASGAAIGEGDSLFGLFGSAPRFGEIQLSPTSTTDGAVSVQLMRLKKGLWRTDVAVPKLAYNATQWLQR